MSRFRASTESTAIRKELDRHRIECSSDQAEFLAVYFSHKFEGTPVAETVAALRTIIGRSRLSPIVRVDALHLLARLTLHAESIGQNESYRQQALELARSRKWYGKAFSVLVNWAFALIESNLLNKARDRVNEAEAALRHVPQREVQMPAVTEARSRLRTHQAKLLLLTETHANAPAGASAVVSKAIQLYEGAISLIRERDHLRVNQQIEMCEYVAKCYERLNLPDELHPFFERIQDTLREAQRSLDSHNCEYCRAYFGEILSRVLFLKGRRAVTHSRATALALWDQAATEASASIATFELVGHVEARLPRQTLADIEAEKLRLQRRIFLSHSSKDQPLVREYKSILESLHYEPWLDEDQLRAGDQVEKGLLHGVRESCAVVFFVTENFIDDCYLEAEVNYAISEKRRRGDAFRIIALVFGDTGAPRLPELLAPYVYKAPKTQLEALSYILESLPLEPGSPTWRV